MPTTHPVIRLGGVAAVFLTLAACTTQEGTEGNYYFKYEHPGIWAFGTDVAVGTRVDVGVYADEDATEPVDVASATLEPADVFDVVDIQGNRLILEALAEGDVELSVSRGEVHDHVDMTAATFDTLDWHVPDPFQVSDEIGDFAAGGTALIPIDLKDGDTLLIGYGVTGITADPASAATIGPQVTHGDVYFVHVDFETAGAVSLLHPEATALALTVVEPSAITALEWDAFGATTVSLEGTATPIFLDARQANERLVFGLAGVATVQTTTPTTCSISASTLWGDGVYEVSGIAAGPCTVSATVGTLTAEWTGDVAAAQ